MTTFSPDEAKLVDQLVAFVYNDWMTNYSREEREDDPFQDVFDLEEAASMVAEAMHELHDETIAGEVLQKILEFYVQKYHNEITQRVLELIKNNPENDDEGEGDQEQTHGAGTRGSNDDEEEEEESNDDD